MIERPTIIEYREPVVYVVFIEDGYNNQVFHTAFTKKSDAEEEMMGFTKMNFVDTQEKKV